MEKEITIPCRVCVVGASGRIGSLLVKKLLERGHTVHATVRNVRDGEKTGVLKSLPGADSRLFLFEVDLFRPQYGQLEPAIHGCHFVFLVAFPTRPPPAETLLDQGRDAGEAMRAALLATLGACERSGTVRRLIYTGSSTAASPLGGDGRPAKDFIDESCWTPPDAPIHYPNDFVKVLDHDQLPPLASSRSFFLKWDIFEKRAIWSKLILQIQESLRFYVTTKTAAEQLLTSYGADKDGRENSSPAAAAPEVVVLTCGLIGGGAIVDIVSGVRELVSPITGDAVGFGALSFLQRLLCSVPVVHQDDVCEAHLFCMGVPLGTHGTGRFLCAAAYPTLGDIIAHHRLSYPDLQAMAANVLPEDCRRRIRGGSTRLKEMGFEYKYGMEQILEDSVRFAKKVGLLKDG